MPNSGCFMAQKTHSSTKQRKRDNLLWKLYNYFIARALPYYIFQIKPASKILPPLHSTLQRHLRKSTNFTIPQ